MTNWNLYETRMTINGTTEKDIQINSIQSSVLDNFFNSPPFVKVLKNGVEQGFNIVEESGLSTNANKKKAICKPNESIIVGDIIEFDNSNWICTEKDSNFELYDIGIISRCTNTLLFYPNESSDLSGTGLISTPCIIGKSNIGLDVNKFMSLPADEYIVTCPNNADSSYINEQTRFILGKSAYKVLGISDIEVNGLLVIRVKEDQKNADDNLILGIANYWSNQVTKEIYILNGTEASLLYTNATLQLNVQCKDNSVVVDNPTVTYTTSSDYVCSVVDGLITALGTGDAIVTATYGTATSSIAIHSEMVVSDNYNIVLSPTDITLKLSRSLVLTAHAMKNGVEDLTKQFVWSLSNLDGSNGAYANIVSDGAINDKTCTILASSLSSVTNKVVVVRCALAIDTNVYTERQIKIINLF